MTAGENMKALILNSGMGSRMGILTSGHRKCMMEISQGETILPGLLIQFADAGITEVVMSTGYCDSMLTDCCESLGFPLWFTFVKNPVCDRTNYISSICRAQEYLGSDIILMHGDLVFESEVFDRSPAEGPVPDRSHERNRRPDRSRTAYHHGAGK